MRFRKVDPPPKTPVLPFPIKLYLVGMSPDGNEAVRTDLNLTIVAFGETVHLQEFAVTLEAN